MTFLEHLHDAMRHLAVFAELDVDPALLPASALGLSDASVRELLQQTAHIAAQVATLHAVLAGVASARSGRDRGHGGLVQETGHRTTVEFLRDVTGTTRGEAARAVRVGEALLDGMTVDDGSQPTPEKDAGSTDGRPREDTATRTVWHQPLRDALLAGAITTAQHHVIRSGLGEPPAIAGRNAEAVVKAWRTAARRLAQEASSCTVEDLAARARALRDMLDPVGAEDRYAVRFANRSFRWSTAPDGARRAHVTFDDEAGLWAHDLMAAALSPRRGGPRFVADDQRKAAEALTADPRTNDQLAYDLFLDLLRAGALASADDVYGTREAGVRLVAVQNSVAPDTARRDAFDRLIATAHSDDGALVVPGSVLERALCTTGGVDVVVDRNGNPLDVGREQRLFTAKQRLALAIRDGGCRWPGCDRPPAYCEAHHCDHWARGGRTDCDRGVLLCRYHHLHLHNAGWRIDSGEGGLLLLHPPTGTAGPPIPLRSRAPLRWLWDPPPRRPHWRTTA